MQLFMRFNSKQKWQAVSNAWPVVVGRNGLAWGNNFKSYATAEMPIKREGDGKAIAGAFRLNSAFGFSATSNNIYKYPYIKITPSLVCVDDPESHYYGRIIDSANITDKDWKSAEMMAEVPFYRKGLIVDYNSHGQMSSSGSCIFMHIKNANAPGTAGCTAMKLPYLTKALEWINPSANPVLVQLPQEQYLKLQASWGLPSANIPCPCVDGRLT